MHNYFFQIKKIHSIWFLGFLLLLVSCDTNFKEIQRFSKNSLIPNSEAENFVLRHTDSAQIKSILKSPLVYDYNTIEFPFTEFPKGVSITMFDTATQKSYIIADYAINFQQSEIIDLQGNVKITSHNGDILETSQLYYDKKREWIFTEKKCKLTNNKGIWHFEGFDSNSNLTKLEARNFRGSGVFEEK